MLQRLGEILNLDKAGELSGEAIIKLWNAHFTGKRDAPYIHASISPEAYAVFVTKAASCPVVCGMNDEFWLARGLGEPGAYSIIE